jgi:hypothetical protein
VSTVVTDSRRRSKRRTIKTYTPNRNADVTA